jgi:hypothetical protein
MNVVCGLQSGELRDDRECGKHKRQDDDFYELAEFCAAHGACPFIQSFQYLAVRGWIR